MTTFSGILAVFIAFLSTCFAVTVSLWQIMMHLKNYTEPTYQRYIVRIIFMVPVYATMSFLALVFGNGSIFFNTIRDVYEAWVIYNFLSLCLAWVGGPGAVVTNLHGRLLKPSLLLMTCCLPAMPLDGRFIRRCKQGCLQFVFLKPVLATLCLVLYSYGKYEDGNFSPKKGYLYITLVYMVSYSLAVYSLVLFYVACKDLLKPFKPIPKFIMIKSVVVLTYWQGVVVFLLSMVGFVRNDREAADLQNFLICIEMALGAMGFIIAFPHKPYMEANVGEGGELTGSISHALNFKDVINDTVHQFAPTYHDYVLYSDGAQEAPRHYRTRTFVPTGQEMDTLRRQKMGGRLLDDFSSYAGSNPVSRNVSTNTQPEVENSVDVSNIPTSKIESKIDMKSRLLHSVHLANQGGYDMRPLAGLPPLSTPPVPPSAPPSTLAPTPTLAPSPSLSLSLSPSMGTNSGTKTGTGKLGEGGGAFDSPKRLMESPGGSRRESVGNSSVGGSDDSRRTSGTDVGEETRLTKGRRGSSGGHGMLLDEIDFVGEDDVNTEGHIQR